MTSVVVVLALKSNAEASVITPAAASRKVRTGSKELLAAPRICEALLTIFRGLVDKE
jgi:hypothetical protein